MKRGSWGRKTTGCRGDELHQESDARWGWVKPSLPPPGREEEMSRAAVGHLRGESVSRGRDPALFPGDIRGLGQRGRRGAQGERSQFRSDSRSCRLTPRALLLPFAHRPSEAGHSSPREFRIWNGPFGVAGPSSIPAHATWSGPSSAVGHSPRGRQTPSAVKAGSAVPPR